MTDFIVFDADGSSASTVTQDAADVFEFDVSADSLVIGVDGVTEVTDINTGADFLVVDSTLAPETVSTPASDVDFIVFDSDSALTTVVTLEGDSEFLVITSSGPQGERGIPGPIDSSQGSYAHSQAVASAVWDIIFDLPFIPSITIVDSAGSVVGGDILIVSPTHIRLNFTAPFSGSAYLS